MSESISVQTIETTQISPEFKSYRGYLRHENPAAVQAADDFYEMVDVVIEKGYREKLDDCRSRAWFVRNKDTGDVRVAAKQCRLRWCFHCSEAKQQFITNAISPWWKAAKEPKLLTLTIKSNDDPLSVQTKFLYHCFTKLRQRKFVKDKIRGGVWFYQVTYNKETRQWHPHIHVLIDSPYLDHSELKVAWKKITMGSTIVHIRLVHDPEKTLAHNARYAARPVALLSIPEYRWGEMFEAFDGRRICGTFGTAKEISMRPQKPDDSDKWVSVGGFKTVLMCRDMDEDARAIWRAWLGGTQIPKGVTMSNLEDEIYDTEHIYKPPPDEIEQQWLDFMTASSNFYNGN